MASRRHPGPALQPPARPQISPGPPSDLPRPGLERLWVSVLGSDGQPGGFLGFPRCSEVLLRCSEVLGLQSSRGAPRCC